VWAKGIVKTNYFTYPSTSALDRESSLVNTISTLTLTATIAFIDFNQDFSNEGMPAKAYLRDVKTLIEVHTAFAGLLETRPNAAPVVFGWSFILNIIAIRLQESPDPSLKPFIDAVVPGDIAKANGDAQDYELLALVAEDLAQSALSLDPFALLIEAYSVLPNFIIYANIFRYYLQASLPYISLTENVVTFFYKVIGPFPELAEEFFLDPFGDKFYSLAALRFPAALKPMLLFAQSLGKNAFSLISNLNTYMNELPRSFKNYSFVQDTTTIELNTDIVLLQPNKLDQHSALILPQGTKGQTYSLNNTRYAIWQYDYNGWTYLMRILEFELAASEYSANSVDIVELLTNTLATLSELEANSLLDICSRNLATNDVVEVIFRILDDSAYLNVNALAEACVKFASVLTLFYPDRVWSYLGRSKLLERNGQKGLMTVLLGSIEIVNGNYDFTISILDLVKSLVESVISGILTSQVSRKVQSEILSRFIAHVVGIFESFAFWAYTDPKQKVKIADSCVTIFSLLLKYSLEIDEAASMPDKVTSVLAPAIGFLADQFLSTSKVTLRTLQPLLSTVESTAWATTNLDSEFPLSTCELDWLQSALRFSADIVKARPTLNLPPSLLERNLYMLAPHLAMLYTRYANLRSAVIDLFIAIVSAPNSEQPSLLAHLGIHAHMFISNLTGSLENGLESEETIQKIAICFSSIIHSHQEGLSILLLTGRDTRKTSNIETEATSLLQVIEQKVSNDTNLPQLLQYHLLSSLMSAYSNWKVGAFKSKTELIDALIKIVKKNHEFNLTKRDPTEVSLKWALQNTMTEKALDIFAIQLYKAGADDERSKKIIDFFKTDGMLKKLSNQFLSIQGFKSSLHGELVRNFDTMWPSLGGIKKFSRATQVSMSYGDSYLYDLDILDRALSGQGSWAGYRKEVIRANLNYSWIDSQLCLVKAWCTVNTSLAAVAAVKKDKDLFKLLASVASTAIKSVLNEGQSIPILRNAIHQRVELAFIVRYQASKFDAAVTDVASFLDLYHLLVSADFEFLRAISASGNADVAAGGVCYRHLLRAILLSLDTFATDRSFKVAQAVHGLLDLVVVKGMYAAVHAAVEIKSSDAVDDIVLIITTLRKALKIPGVSHSAAAALLTESGTGRAVMSLYSYAQSIIARDDEWAFGELSLAYILEWLNVDTLADHFVSNGLLNVLIESPVSQPLQNGGIRPTTHPKLYALWVNGILPIAVVVLQKLGYRVVQDILLLVDSFSDQIRSALAGWRNPAELTLATITETSQIILLLEVICKLDTSPTSNDTAAAVADVLSRADLAASFDYLLSHPRFLNASIVATSLEEHKLSIEKVSNAAATSGEEPEENNKLLAKFQELLRDTKDMLEIEPGLEG
jgi:nuclear pore complex protein Nup188